MTKQKQIDVHFCGLWISKVWCSQQRQACTSCNFEVGVSVGFLIVCVILGDVSTKERLTWSRPCLSFGKVYLFDLCFDIFCVIRMQTFVFPLLETVVHRRLIFFIISWLVFCY